MLTGCDQLASPPLPVGNGGGRLAAESQEPDVRNALLEKLQGKTLEQKLQILLDIVKQDASESARRDALDFICGLGKDASPLAEALAEQLLLESNVRMVPDLKTTLVEIQADVENYFITAAASADEAQRLRIIDVLGELSKAKPETLSFLAVQFEAKNQTAKVAAIKAVGKIGPAAQGMLPKLNELAGRPRVPLEGSTDGGRAFRASRDLQGAAVRAIEAVGADKSSIDVLTAALSQEPQIAEPAARALGTLGPAAASALKDLEKLAARNDHGGKDIKTRLAREAAAEAIQLIGRPAK
ncbi:hypothetical protein SH139x_005491 [Planctomycetaceae bacterium SH139]